MKLILVFTVLFAGFSCSKPAKDKRPPLKFEVADNISFPFEVKAGEGFSFTVKLTGNDTPVHSFDVRETNLPSTVVIDFTNSEEAKVSGSVNKPGTYTFTLGATCKGTQVSGQTGKKEFTVIIKQ